MPIAIHTGPPNWTIIAVLHKALRDPEYMIRIENLCKSVDTSEGLLTILKSVSLDIDTGEAVAIVGASGSGKSTLLGLMAGLDTATSGDVVLSGQSLNAMDEEQRAVLRGKLVGFVFQSCLLYTSDAADE